MVEQVVAAFRAGVAAAKSVPEQNSLKGAVYYLTGKYPPKARSGAQRLSDLPEEARLTRALALYDWYLKNPEISAAAKKALRETFTAWSGSQEETASPPAQAAATPSPAPAAPASGPRTLFGINNEDVTPNKITPAGYICYINGVLTPIHSATVRYGVNVIPEAQITMFPSKHLHRFGAEDRVEVVLFYLDAYVTDAPEYRLLFEGEIVSWSYQTTADTQALVFRAVADINILSQMNYGLLDSVHKIGKDAVDVNGTSVMPANSIFMKAALLHQGLVPTENAPGSSAASINTRSPTIKNPYDILENVLMALCGSKNHSGQKINTENRVAAINFFSRWARRRNFVNRFIASPDFDEYDGKDPDGVFPILRGMEGNELLSALQRRLDEYSQRDFYAVIRRIFDDVFYELQMLPTANCVKVTHADGRVAPNGGFDEAKHRIRLNNYYGKPRMFFAIPPMCNVMFPSMVRSFNYTEMYLEQPTRLYVNSELTMNLLNLPPSSTIEALTKAVTAVAYPRQAEAVLDAVLGRHFTDMRLQDLVGADTDTAKKAYRVAKNTLIWKEEFYKGPQLVEGTASQIYGMYVNLLKDQKGTPLAKQIYNALTVYAENEFYIRRYNKRAGMVETVFNPYMVHGYPGVIFDRHHGLHLVAYMVEVQHNLTPTGMSTSATYTGGRTLNEWLDKIKEDAAFQGEKIHSAPADPLIEVRKVTQILDKASEHYKKLFYSSISSSRRSTGVTSPRPTAFDFTQVLNVAGDHGAATPINYSVVAATDSKSGRTRRPTKPSERAVAPAEVTLNVTTDNHLVASPAYEQIFSNTTLAMQLVARPICTLDDYIRFRHGLKPGTADDMAKFVAGTTHEYGPSATAGAVRTKMAWAVEQSVAKGHAAGAYSRVYDVSYDSPDTDTIQKVSPYYTDGRLSGSTQPILRPVTDLKVLPGTAYQTAKDWTTILKAYREEVESAWPKEP